jgi:transmembrane sensor
MEEIVIRSLQGSASSEELERLVRWREADPENERSFLEIASLWAATNRGQRRAPRPEAPSSFEIIRAARLREAARRPSPEESPSGRWTRRIAAAIALMAAGFAGSLFPGPQPLLAGGHVSTSATEMATVTLGDGTLVRLGPSSRVRLPDEPETREVWLEGEAFFSVAAVEDRPFTVRTGSGVARSLETRFRVETKGGVMKVGVLEGKVAVSAGETESELVGGQVGRIAGGNVTVQRASGPEELRPQLGNFLAFRSTPLSAVLEEVSDHYGLPARVEDQELGGRTVTASFQDASFVEVMSVVCRITASRCAVTDSTASVVGSDVR